MIEKETSYVIETESSARGRVINDLLFHLTNDFTIGKKIKSGELRKKLVSAEPEWKVPDAYNMTHFDLKDFSMKMLSKKANPNMEKVILQLHGGGYIGAIRNIYYNFAEYYCERSRGCNVLSPDYRTAPENCYPAALRDAITAYDWLLEMGYKANQIILAGDSAGGGLVLALTMYLRDHGLSLPCGIIAMSPWTDLTASGESYESNFEKDALFGKTKESIIYINDYPGDEEKTHPYISPVFGEFHDFPPILIQVGSTEMLLSDSLVVAEKLKEAGCEVRLSVYEDMFHVFQMSGMLLPESKKAWTEVEKFIDYLYE
uniref:alpha/beta hydrolase n=1 Tax=Agathobacter sp. TaxID=2021311 RepID=UPI00405698EA